MLNSKDVEESKEPAAFRLILGMARGTGENKLFYFKSAFRNYDLLNIRLLSAPLFSQFSGSSAQCIASPVHCRFNRCDGSIL
jgi:hypothetical protein